MRTFRGGILTCVLWKSTTHTKPHLPVHLVLGAGEYTRIKTATKPLVGREGEPIAEKTKLRWFIMSPGNEVDTLLFAKSSQKDYEELCRLDVLGLSDSAEHSQQTVYSEFKEQLSRSPEGWYKTGLPWRGSHNPLPDNEQGSLRRLANLIEVAAQRTYRRLRKRNQRAASRGNHRTSTASTRREDILHSTQACRARVC